MDLCKEKFVQKRDFERKVVNIPIRLICGSSNYFGIVTNCSEKGMYIRANISFPMASTFNILIPLEKRILTIPVKISRLVNSEGFYNAMGVELINPPISYLEFAKSLKFDFKIQ